jgi:hypothetical protein
MIFNYVVNPILNYKLTMLKIIQTVNQSINNGTRLEDYDVESK